MMAEEKIWLTRLEAAERAGVHLRTVARWLADGTLMGHPVKGRSRILIDADELDTVVRPAPDRSGS